MFNVKIYKLQPKEDFGPLSSTYNNTVIFNKLSKIPRFYVVYLILFLNIFFFFRVINIGDNMKAIYSKNRGLFYIYGLFIIFLILGFFALFQIYSSLFNYTITYNFIQLNFLILKIMEFYILKNLRINSFNNIVLLKAIIENIIIACIFSTIEFKEFFCKLYIFFIGYFYQNCIINQSLYFLKEKPSFSLNIKIINILFFLKILLSVGYIFDSQNKVLTYFHLFTTVLYLIITQYLLFIIYKLNQLNKLSFMFLTLSSFI
jgi:hypothetical protein